MLQTQHPGIVAARRQTPQLIAKPLCAARNKSICRALEITGDAYEDIVDQLARRALDRHSAGGAASNSASGSSSGVHGLHGLSRPARLVVGIAGAPGSGKTTLAAAVAARINQLQGQGGAEGAAAAAGGGGGGGEGLFAAVMPMDGFHYYRRELDAMPDPQEAHARRGAPWTFDAAKFVEAVRRVRLAGQAPAPAAPGAAPSDGAVPSVPGDVLLPSFDHGVGDPVEGDIRVAADTAVVLVEGNYILLDQEPWRQLRGLFDETWFVSCPMELIEQRLFDRQTGIGLAPEVSRQRIRTNDLPNAELVAACGGAASVLVPGWVPPRGNSTGKSSSIAPPRQQQRQQQAGCGGASAAATAAAAAS